MQYGVTVWAYGPQILDGIDAVRLANLGQRAKMMDGAYQSGGKAEASVGSASRTVEEGRVETMVGGRG